MICKNSASKKLNIIFSLMLIIIMFSVFSITKKSYAANSNAIAPNFNLKVLNHNFSGYKNINLSALKGKVVLVNFWATWCPPCRAEIPSLISFYNKNKSKNFIIVGINVNVTKKGVRAFTHQYKMDYPVVHATSKVLHAYNGMAIPQTFFISKTGKIAFHWKGMLPKSVLSIVSEHLMKK